MLIDQLPKRLEIRNPGRIRKVFLTVLISLAMCTCSFVTFPLGLQETSIALLVLSPLLIIVGLWMLSTVPRLFRLKISMILTYDNFEQETIYGNIVVPWEGVEQIGSYKLGYNKFVGIRLHTYENLLSNLAPEVSKKMNRLIKSANWINHFGLFAAGASDFSETGIKLGKRVGGTDPVELLKDNLGVKNYAQSLLHFRESNGYEIGVDYGAIDRSPEEFITLLHEYWNNAVNSK